MRTIKVYWNQRDHSFAGTLWHDGDPRRVERWVAQRKRDLGKEYILADYRLFSSLDSGHGYPVPRDFA